ncbi:hypothetical protein [Xenorhabdus eapokensis]|uniref:hypothetical protein n=1 Tax=Xenorhabdus eapokensis TaxID=1873482 RepID=UPI003BB81001
MAQRTFEMILPSGEAVLAKEHFYIVKFDKEDINTLETVYSNDIPEIYRHYLKNIGFCERL